jgi:hypothetical protein
MSRPRSVSAHQAITPSPSASGNDSAEDVGSALVVALYLVSFLAVCLFCLTGFIARLWQ